MYICYEREMAADNKTYISPTPPLSDQGSSNAPHQEGERYIMILGEMGRIG